MSRLATVGIWALLLGSLGIGGATAQEEPEAEEAWTPPVKVEHELEGRNQCLMCHAGGIKEAPAVPVNHVDRPNETCMWCHAPDADVQTIEPTPIPHKMEGRSGCLMCHLSETVKEVPQVPATHAGRTEEYCTLCHAPAKKG